jgi:peptidoglycan/LPS O-acetylase OafA/YrhL
MNVKASRLEYLDSLRGLASLSVFFSHYVASYVLPNSILQWASKSPFSILRDGFAGVSLFFVLSGFVLSYKYFQKSDEYDLGRSIIPFYIGRISRICIPFTVILLISASLSKLLHLEAPNQIELDWIRNFWTDQPSWSQVMSQAFLFVPAATQHLLPQDWTLTIELKVSMLMPFFTLIAIKNPFWLFFLVFLLIKNHWYFVHFALGILIARYFNLIQDKVRKCSPVLKMTIFAVAVFLYSFRFAGLMQTSEDVMWIITGLGASLIIILAIGSQFFQNFLQIPFLVYLGKISYSIYLVHFIILKTFCHFLFLEIFKLGIQSQSTAHLIVVPSALVVLIMTADLSYRFIERPAIALGKRLTELPKNEDLTET